MATFEITFSQDPNHLIGQSIADYIFLPQILQEEMLNTRARIIADTTAGRDAEGIALKPYSRSYTEAIDSGRIFGKAPGEHTPNLTATGQLMRSMQIEQTSPLEVRMFFQGTHSKAKRVSARYAKKKRTDAIKAGATLHTRKNAPTEVKAVRASAAASVRSRVKFNAAVGRGSRKLSSEDKNRGAAKGGGDLTNAALAQAQYDMGRPYWFAFSQLDIDRILGRISAQLLRIGSVLF